MIDPRIYVKQEEIAEIFNDNPDEIKAIDLSEEYGFEYAANLEHKQLLIVHKSGVVAFYDTDPNEDNVYQLCPKYNYLQDSWYLELGDQNQFKYSNGSWHPINLYCGGKPIAYFALLFEAFEDNFQELENGLYDKYIKGDIENPYSPQWKRVEDFKDVLVSERGQVIVCNFLSKDKNRFKNNEILNAFNSVYYSDKYNEYEWINKISDERERDFSYHKIIYQCPVVNKRVKYFDKTRNILYCNDLINRYYKNNPDDVKKINELNEIMRRYTGNPEFKYKNGTDEFTTICRCSSYENLLNQTWPEKAKEIREKRIYNNCAYIQNTNNYKKGFNYYENCY